jgi:DNA-binding transcriptional MerR regulator
MSGPTSKSSGALRTIGEISAETGLPHHVLRYWETRFPALRPLQRAGNRRYYRPEDAALVRRIDLLLNKQGYTIRGVQQLLAAESGAAPAGDAVAASLTAIRNLLADALATDARR